MEKISSIVRGNPRVASVDMNTSAPVRSGVPSFGRNVSESTGQVDRSMSTAQKAVSIHNQMIENKKQATSDRTVQGLADQFFMSRVRRPEEQPSLGAIAPKSPGGEIKASADVDEDVAAEIAAPAEELIENKYTPRGSYIDVRA